MATYDIAVEVNTVVRENPGATPVQIIQTSETSFKFDLLADPLGRLGRVTDKLKLSQQMLFAILNVRMSAYLKIFRPIEYRPAIIAALEAFKRTQEAFIMENDANLLGWDVLKLNRRTNEFVQLNGDPIRNTIVDTDIRPGRLEVYQIARRTQRFGDRNVVVEVAEITPPVSGGTFDIRQNFAVFPERKSITFFFPPNRTFTRGEILVGVEDVVVRENTEDPRNGIISMRVVTLEGERINVTSRVPIRQGLSFV